MEEFRVYTETINGYKKTGVISNEDDVISYLDYIIVELFADAKVLIIKHSEELGDSPYYCYKGAYRPEQVEWLAFKEAYYKNARKIMR